MRSADPERAQLREGAVAHSRAHQHALRGVQEAVSDPHVGFQVRDARGEVLYRAHTHGLGTGLGDASAGDVIEVDFSFAPDLMPGDYTLTVGIGAGGKAAGALAHSLLRHQDVVSFSVIRSAEDDFWDGVVNLRPQVMCRYLPGPDPR